VKDRGTKGSIADATLHGLDHAVLGFFRTARHRHRRDCAIGNGHHRLYVDVRSGQARHLPGPPATDQMFQGL